MIHFEREVKDPVLIEEMLKMFNIVNVGINGDDGYPYVVPLNFGFEVKDNKFIFYTHFMKRGLKVDLIKKIQKYVWNLVLLMIFLIINIKGIIMIIVVLLPRGL